MPASRARSSALRSGLVRGHRDQLHAVTAVSAIDQRLQVGAGARGQDGDSHAARSLGKRPPVERSVPAARSSIDPTQDLVGVQMRERPVAGQPVVGVLDHDLGATAAQDLHRSRASDRWPGALDHVHDRRVQSLRPPAPETAGAARSRHQRRIAHVAAGHLRRRLTSGHRSRTAPPRGDTRSPRRTPRSPGTAPSARARPREPSSRRSPPHAAS